VLGSGSYSVVVVVVEVVVDMLFVVLIVGSVGCTVGRSVKEVSVVISDGVVGPEGKRLSSSNDWWHL